MPLTIALAAVALVKNIQDGCELYKQAKESFVEIKETYDEVAGIAQEVGGFLGPIVAFIRARFGGVGQSRPPPRSAPQGRAKPAAKFVAVNETKVKADIVKNLSEFFTLQEKLAAKIREEEEQSQSVYDPDQNHNIAAMNRVLALQEMARLEVTIRETMVYQSPPEMGALFTEVAKMREVIREEQEQARLKQEANERHRAWQQNQRQGRLRVRIAVFLAALFLVGYLHLWLQILRLKTTTTPPF